VKSRREPLFFRSLGARVLLASGLLLTLVTCRDGTGPEGLHYARVAVAPVFPSEAGLAAFGLAIDRVRFVVVRPIAPPDTVADTTVALPPDARVLDLSLRVPIVTSPETVLVSIVALAGAVPLFEGTAPVEVSAGLVAPPTEVPVTTYVGPGAGVDSIAIAPRTPFIYFGDSLRFQVQAFQGGTPVQQFYVSWSTSDTALAHVNGAGLLRAPINRSSVRVVARTPAGVRDSVLATFQPLANQLVRIAGNLQSDTVGRPLALPLQVEARAADGLGVAGVAVHFRAQLGGGSVADTLVLTDSSGQARTVATLGLLIGAQSFQATAAGLSGSPVTFDMMALGSAPTQLLSAAGDAQLAVVNTVVAVAPRVLLKDAAGNPVAGVPVTFTVTGGGGSLSGGNQTTDASGIATVTSWTLGTLAGTNTLLASAAGLSRTFTATGIAGAAAQLVATAGDLQSGVVGGLLPIKPAVRLQDQYGNPIAGAAVTFAVNPGAGSITGPAQLTNAGGVAAVGSWTLDTLAGTNVLHATTSALSTTFNATGLPDMPSLLVKTLGDSQIGVVNAPLPTAPTVRLTDRYKNPIAGDTINFSILTDGGFVATPISVTNASGVASAGAWTLANFLAQNVLRAEVQSVPAVVPVQFTALGTHDVAAQLLRVTSDTQTALVNSPVGVPPEVKVVDQYFNPVPGVSVTFTLTGTLIGSLLPGTAVTDSTGIARVGSWTLAAVPGLNTLDAAVSGLAGSPVTFSANGITTTASTIVLNTGDLQTGIVGSTLATPYSVAVKDAVGLPVSGVPVRWAVGAGGGFITPATSATDANGIASATRTLGGSPGTQTATASVSGLTGSPVPFSATALTDAPAQIVKLSLDPQSAIVGSAVSSPPSVRVVDQFGNAVAGVGVTFAGLIGGGSVTGATQTTDALGIAMVGSWTLGTVAGLNNNSVTASVSGLPAVTFMASGIAGAPARLVFLTEPTRALAGDTIAPAVQVAIQDLYGNLVISAKDVVSLGLGATPNPAAKLQGIVDAAAVNGVASFPYLAVDSAGLGYAIAATSGTLTGAASTPFDIGGVIKAIPVTRLGAVAAAMNDQTKKIYVPGATLVSVLLDDRELQPQLTGFESPFGVAANATTNQVYVSSLAGVAAIDGTVDVVRLFIPVGTSPKGVAVDETANRIYVAVAADPLQRGPALVPIDGSTDIVATTDIVFLPAPGSGVVFNPNDGFVYVAIPTFQEVDVINPKPGGATLVGRIQNLGKGTYGLAVDTRANRLYVTNRDDNNVSVIDISAPDPGAFKEIARLPVGAGPEAVAFDASRGVAYVVNTGENTVSLIDDGKLGVFATLVVGPNPKAAVVDPVTGRVYVPTQTDDMVRVIQP